MQWIHSFHQFRSSMNCTVLCSMFCYYGESAQNLKKCLAIGEWRADNLRLPRPLLLFLIFLLYRDSYSPVCTNCSHDIAPCKDPQVSVSVFFMQSLGLTKKLVSKVVHLKESVVDCVVQMMEKVLLPVCNF